MASLCTALAYKVYMKVGIKRFQSCQIFTSCILAFNPDVFEAAPVLKACFLHHASAIFSLELAGSDVAVSVSVVAAAAAAAVVDVSASVAAAAAVSVSVSAGVRQVKSGVHASHHGTRLIQAQLLHLPSQLTQKHQQAMDSMSISLGDMALSLHHPLEASTSNKEHAKLYDLILSSEGRLVFNAQLLANCIDGLLVAAKQRYWAMLA